MKSETKKIQLNSLQPFKRHTGRTYEGERLQLLMDHWYANIGRYDIRCKEKEVVNLCDNILMKILSCSGIPEMLRLHYSYYNKIMQ